MPQLLTLREVARMLNVSERTIQRLAIKYVKVGRLRRYKPADVERYLDSSIARERAVA